MINKEQFVMKGYFILQAVDADTNEVIGQTEILENTLTTINRTYRQAMLDGRFTSLGLSIDALEIQFIGLGIGTTASAETDTQLENETFRKQITSIESNAENTVTILQLIPSEANFRIREIGVFSGPNATATANSGNMISRINVDFTKNSNIRLNIIRIDRTVI